MPSGERDCAGRWPAPPARERVIYRHTLLVRVTHWINALCFALAADERAADFQRPSRALLGRAQRLSTSRFWR